MAAFAGAHNFTINNPQFIEHVSDGSNRIGLKKLLKASFLGASHDSSERHPPPTCHPGTRKNYIEKLVHWSLNSDNHSNRLAWVKGPAGVGKSAIAQSFAEVLGDKLGASFFFSRPNQRDDPNRFFTSIAYQLAVKHDPYGTILDHEIHRDPSLITKSLPHQFHSLFVTPFLQSAIREEVGERIILIDGLDECTGMEAQVEVIKIVADSIKAGTTPFLWIFFSRLEPSIVTTFNLPRIKLISLIIDLPVSREIDKEILLYLSDKLTEVGHKHGLVLPWPSEEEIWVLVDFSAGLFACAHAIFLFISEDDPAGPVDQLRVVLRLAKHSATKSPTHPFSKLNDLYTLIMERIPPKMLQTVQWILLSTRLIFTRKAIDIANLLGLTELQFRNACRCLHSVGVLEGGDDPKIQFYHASFMDFLGNPDSSKDFSIWSGCAGTLLDEILRKIDQLRVYIEPSKEIRQYSPRVDITWPRRGSEDAHNHTLCYFHITRAFFKLVFLLPLSNDTSRFQVLKNFDFKRLCFMAPTGLYYLSPSDLESLMRGAISQSNLLRPCVFRNLLASYLLRSKSYGYRTIGHGEKKALLEIGETRLLTVHAPKPRLVHKLVKELCEKPPKGAHCSTERPVGPG